MLTKRLAACAEQVTHGGVVCDVGTDHAYLLAELLRHGICTGAVATDIHAGPLEAARRTLTEAGVLSRTTLLLCDGLEAVSPDGITDVVIAGMGAETMIHILSSCAWANQVHLILQPMTKVPLLREWLAAHGFGTWRERVVTEGNRFYHVLCVRYDGKNRSLSMLEREIGCLDWTDSDVQHYAVWKAERIRKLAQKLEIAKRPESREWRQLASALERCVKQRRNESC